MIDGVTILNNVTVSDFNPIPWLGVLIGFLVLSIICCIIFNDNCFNTQDRKGIVLLLSTVFILVLICFISDISSSKVDAIQCTIDDNVSINEVYDNYDVIDKQGEIWTLREKTSEEA